MKMAATFPVADLTDLDVAFPTDVSRLLPRYADIPATFKDGHTKWNDLFSAWFFTGVENLKLTPKPGIDTAKALRHIKAAMGSFEPAHEHKEAGVAFLLDQWFSDGTWTAKRETSTKR